MKIPNNWVIAEAVIIVHVPTGNVIPQPSSRFGRGGSHVEPVDPKKKQPRIFANEFVAKACLGQWLRGKQTCYRYSDGGEDLKITPTPHRIKADMKILPVVLIPKEL